MSELNQSHNKIPERFSDSKLDLGIYGKENKSNSTIIDISTILISIVWVVFSIFFLTFGEDRTDENLEKANFLLNCLAVFIPVVVIVTFSIVLKMSGKLKGEVLKLQTEIDAMRRTYVTQQQVSGLTIRPGIEKKINEIEAAQKKTDNEVAKFSTRRETNEHSDQKAALSKSKATFKNDEPPLPLEVKENDIGSSNPSILIGDFIKAADLPNSPDDKESLDALRKALEDRDLAKLLNATQDTLQILSKEGIYLDALNVEPGDVKLWREFGKGKRGKSLSGIVRFSEDEVIEKVNMRFRTDTVFKDVVHHFLRQFDSVFTEFNNNASDDDIAIFSNTRTAITFLILASVAGTFD